MFIFMTIPLHSKLCMSFWYESICFDNNHYKYNSTRYGVDTFKNIYRRELGARLFYRIVKQTYTCQLVLSAIN